MTYKQGKKIIDSIFEATARGYETDAQRLSIFRISLWFDRGEIGARTFDRLNNYIFDKTAFEIASRA